MATIKKALKSSVATSRTSRSSTTTAKASKPRSVIGSPDEAQIAQARPSSGSIRIKKTPHSEAERKLEIVLKRLAVSKLRCIDVETSGLDWKRNHLVGYVVCFGPNDADSYYIPFRHLGNANVGGRQGPTTATNWDGELAPGEQELVEAIDKQGVTNFGHNYGFDLKFLSRVGLKFRSRCEDMIINEPLLDEFAGKFSLDACTTRRGVQAKKSGLINDYLCGKFPEAAKAPKQAMGHFWRLAGDDPTAVTYAEGDGPSTWQLRDAQMKDIRKIDTYAGREMPSLEQVWDVESRLIPVLARMSVRGIKIDEEGLSNLRREIKTGLERLYGAFPSGFNARSPGDVQDWMSKHGCTDWPRTAPTKRFPQGSPSMNKAWLENHEAGRQIVKVRKLETLRDTFVMPLQTDHLFKGRVHTTYNQLRNDEFGVVVGRLSSNDPNLQAVPKHDEEIGYIYREVFKADDGMTWGSPDINQCEPRLLAFYSRCKVLLEGYRATPPLDAHTAVAMVANKNWANLDKAAQKQYRGEVAKRINQTVITGGGKGVLVAKYKMNPNEVDKFWNDYFKAMPEIRTIQKRMAKVFRERGYILTLLNRRCRFDGDRDYVALNRALQGGNADVLKSKMVEVDDYLAGEGYPIDMLNNCHDAVDYQFTEDNRKHYDKCLEIMQDFTSERSMIKLDIPMPVDGGEGPNWAVATYGAKK